MLVIVRSIGPVTSDVTLVMTLGVAVVSLGLFTSGVRIVAVVFPAMTSEDTDLLFAGFELSKLTLSRSVSAETGLVCSAVSGETKRVSSCSAPGLMESLAVENGVSANGALRTQFLVTPPTSPEVQVYRLRPTCEE